jgi:beta-glucanase (GH16 family)
MKKIKIRAGRLLTAWILVCCGAMAAAQPPAGSTWEMTFSDEFSGTALDRNKWSVGYGWGRTTGWTQEYIADDHVLVQNGLLRLKQSNTAQNGKPYTAGAVNSKGKFTQKYGYFEARIKMNTSYGMHFGWWAKQSDDDWPPELDIMELVAREPWRYTNNIHYLNDAGAKYDRPYADAQANSINQTLDYHVYGCEWRPDAIIFFVDGQERRRITDPTILGYFHRNAGAPNYTGGDPFYLLFNVHIGHDWAGYPNSSTVWPNYMDIDWVRVYKKGTTSTPTTNLVRNGEFDNGTTDWVLFKNTGTTASLAAVTGEGLSGTNSGRVYIDNGGTADWHVSVGQALPISSGKTYRISFRAKVGAARSIRVGIQQNGGSNTVYWDQLVNLTTTATTYSYNFTSANTDATAALRFFVGGSATDVHLDAVTVTDGSTARVDVGEAKEAGAVTVFPNPAQNKLGVTYRSPVRQAVQLTLRNVHSKSVGAQAAQVQAGPNQLEMNVQTLPNGVYLLELRPATGGRIVRKVVIAR